MRNLIGLTVMAALFCSGCGNEGTPGGPGVKKDPKTNGKQTDGKRNGILGGPAEETFTIDVPATATDVKQGEAKTVKLGLNRGKNFDEDVTLKFDKLPRGVTVEPASPKIAASEKETTITVKAAADATLGDFDVTVTGQPTKGEPATNKLKLQIEKAE
jgi:uncharacterized membrane protein